MVDGNIESVSDLDSLLLEFTLYQKHHMQDIRIVLEVVHQRFKRIALYIVGGGHLQSIIRKDRVVKIVVPISKLDSKSTYECWSI